MKKYIVTYCENPKCGRAFVMVVGVFTDETKASNALEKVFLKACDTFCVDEKLADETQCDTQNSYYNEGKGFNIDYKSLGEVVGEVFGEISDCEEDDMYMDTSIEE